MNWVEFCSQRKKAWPNARCGLMRQLLAPVSPLWIMVILVGRLRAETNIPQK
jgi:hypothetical protein